MVAAAAGTTPVQDDRRALPTLVIVDGPSSMEPATAPDVVDPACAAVGGSTFALAAHLACLAHDDPAHEPWTLEATWDGATSSVVIVGQGTGQCGGCGRQLVAVSIPRDGARPSVMHLGRYGRFGQGPTGLEPVDLAGQPGVLVHAEESSGGYSHAYTMVISLDGTAVPPSVCVTTGSDNGGAALHPAERVAYEGRLEIEADGTLEVVFADLPESGPSRRQIATRHRYAYDATVRGWPGAPADDCIDREPE